MDFDDPREGFQKITYSDKVPEGEIWFLDSSKMKVKEMKPMDRVRVLRILEYEGNRDWVEVTLKARQVKREFHVPAGVIREAIVGEFPTIIEKRGGEQVNPED